MFGYVRPLRGELKCREFDLYRATYCGLCRCLRRRYGMLAPMLLNYDFTLLTLLLWEGEGAFQPCRGRCHANLLLKKPMCPDSPALEMAADASMILTWWKLWDARADEGFFPALLARLLLLLLRPAYKKAARRRPDFALSVQGCLQELAQLERDNCPSLDRTADTFARLLQATAAPDCANVRVLEQVLYHLGRWIYLIDARDDLEEDRRAKRYNPLLARYGPEGDDEALHETLAHSRNIAGAALRLGEFGYRMPVLENVFYLGLPLVEQAVFDGSWAQIKKRKVWRSGA